MSKFGIDVSEHNKIIDWKKVKEKIDFAILRLGWIGNKDNHTLDKNFERNYLECKSLGIPVGVYVYCYSNSIDSAKSGAKWTIKKLNNRELDLPVFIDMEENSIANQGKTILTNICHNFNKIIEENGYFAGVYANKNWFDNYLKKEEIKNRYVTWIATYTSGIDKYKNEYDMWQNSSSAKINGINTNVDTNYMYRDLITEIKNSKKPQLFCRAHIQDFGWTDFCDCKNGIGTENQSKRLEAVQFKGTNIEIEYRVHVQDIGWMDWVKNGEIAGTTGQSKRIEAIEIKSNKTLEVQEHVENAGWLPKFKSNNFIIGTIGKSLRLEAFKINIIE